MNDQKCTYDGNTYVTIFVPLIQHHIYSGELILIMDVAAAGGASSVRRHPILLNENFQSWIDWFMNKMMMRRSTSIPKFRMCPYPPLLLYFFFFVTQEMDCLFFLL
jgi:hypothetical protein